MDFISLFLYSVGLLAAIAVVAYWCYSFRLLLDKEPSGLIKIFFVVMLISFPLFTPAVIYLLYLDYFKKKRLRRVNV